MYFNDRFSLAQKEKVPESKIHLYEKQLTREINLARDIQTHLLNGNKPSLIDGEITGTSIPARLVGGDYFDFYSLANGKLRIIIGDVMGKGIPAAMLMILTRGAFRSAAETQPGPSETLVAMNNALYEDLRGLSSFVTVLCADWDPDNKTLTFANAGHTLPLLIRKKNIVPIPKITGVMLGGLPNQDYKTGEIKLEDNDLVFFYTDGIIEAENKDREQFKIERLITFLTEKNEALTVQEIEEKMIRVLHDFTGDVPQKDDITMVIFKTKMKS
ncbi:PP2C family protein-serine/threonine phosphatase [Halalkalibacterium ligniniphilum]|uniref:PP2C family protein-serine/threonine phosphatase n=1 Tax=Halalkalibacterium ligniniphilum TaxID=1134413 RepID=UPI000344BBBD|nr:PP2C family protein-serine/threonine phosphatase [Halalkalibacterium ligniniphilum]